MRHSRRAARQGQRLDGVQAPHLLKDHLALPPQIDAKNIRVTNVVGASCYGGNGHHLATADAAIMSQMVGQPVRVHWMRHDEHGWELKGPAMVQDLSGSVDGNGSLTGYSHVTWTPPHYAQYYPAGELVGRWVGIPIPGAFNTPVMIYDLPNVSIFQYDQAHFADAIRTGWLRGPAQFQHTFAMQAWVADNEWDAIVGAQNLKVTWSDGKACPT